MQGEPSIPDVGDIRISWSGKKISDTDIEDRDSKFLKNRCDFFQSDELIVLLLGDSFPNDPERIVIILTPPQD